MVPVKKLVAKGGKKGKQVLKFTLECTHPVEDGITDAANFEQFLQERIKVKGKAGNLATRSSRRAVLSQQFCASDPRASKCTTLRLCLEAFSNQLEDPKH
ncbi:hypothetical protein GH733_016175 [Mirounga leonina]|nr:hypothetical protein GH733_016175 [Mirounga leonina]